jgi:dUTP pyrophosphatase
MRKERGAGYLGDVVVSRILDRRYSRAIIDGIRNPAEVLSLRKMNGFYLISVDAPQEIRFERLKKRNRESDPKTWEDFLKVDARDLGIGEPEDGQQVGKCIAMADLHLVNDSTSQDLIDRCRNLEDSFLDKIKFNVKRLKPYSVLPRYANPGDAGMDLVSAEDYYLKPGDRALVSTGLQFEFPIGYELQIRPRSGLALKHGISMPNTPGTIDAGYRGEIGIIVINHGKEDFSIKRGDRIAQAVLNKFEVADIQEVSELGESERGSGGFGSSGKN